MDSHSDGQTRIKEAYQYCESVTKLHAKSFYFAAKFLPKLKQKAVYPIYALCRHVDDEVDEIGAGNEAAAIKAVESWKKKLNSVYFEIQESEIRNQDTNSEDQSPKDKDKTLIFTAWADLLRSYKIPSNLPFELMEGVLMDTHIKRYQTFDDLYLYCYRVASTVGLMSSEILGYSDKIALEYAEAMGIAMQLTNILRDVKEDAAMGRIYLPQEDLQKFGVSETQILANEFNENFARLMKFEAARARQYYAKGEQGIRLLEKDSRFTVLLAARVYAKILDEIEKQNYNVFIERAHTTKSQKLLSIPKIWLAARKI